nr:hypothetical protein [Psychrobacter sp. PraFG1]UNK06238.1 hypothetical protein MN210_06575 [Psychrobacter sp. PraFG1]
MSQAMNSSSTSPASQTAAVTSEDLAYLGLDEEGICLTIPSGPLRLRSS